RFTLFTLCLLLGRFGARPLSAEGRRLPARASAEKSAAGHGPELAVDSDESTLWIASLKPGPENNRVWFQLELGSVQPVARLHWTWPVLRAARVDLYPTDTPAAKAPRPLATLPPQTREYRDRIPNWTPRYYRLEAVDARGRPLLASDLTAAIARPSASASGYADAAPVETFAFWYEPYRPTTDPKPSLRYIGSAAFVIGPGMEAAADLARAGKGLLPYVTFYQTAGWAGSFPKDAD